MNSYTLVSCCVFTSFMQLAGSEKVVLQLAGLEQAFEELQLAGFETELEKREEEKLFSKLPSLDTLFTWWSGLSYNIRPTPTTTMITSGQFLSSLKAVIDLNVKQLMVNLTSGKLHDDVIYAQKLIIPNGSQVYFWGDLHGDISSLVIILKRLVRLGVLDDQLNVIEKNARLIFGGDYVDRGHFGVEVLYTLAQLRARNPNTVFLIRGNHEDIFINDAGGFGNEITNKFTKDDLPPVVKRLKSFYTSLPAVIYVGIPYKDTTYYIHCCHGGFELGHSITTLLESEVKPLDSKTSIASEIIVKLDRKTAFEQFTKADPETAIATVKIFGGDITEIPEEGEPFASFINRTEVDATHTGYLWSDCTVGGVGGRDQKRSYYEPQRGLMYGDRLIEYLCHRSDLYSKKHNLVVVLRGHQHNLSMPGILCAACGGGISDANQSVYLLRSNPISEASTPGATVRPSAFGKNNPINIFTTVATAAYTPSPSVLHIECIGTPDTWIVMNEYIPNFHAQFNTDKPKKRTEFLKKLGVIEASIPIGLWKFEAEHLTKWKNKTLPDGTPIKS